MRIVDKLKSASPAFSFEFFPPKSPEGLERLFETLTELRPYQPAYVSVTYGAFGSTRNLTVDLAVRIKEEIGLEAMAHLTCVGSTRQELFDVLSALHQAGIENVLTLRGDPPAGTTSFEPAPGGFAYASELAVYTRENFDFCLAGACYPEVHPEAASADSDLDALERKVDGGVDFLVTQLFFDNQDFFRFVDKVRGRGITVPIVAGIMPVTNVAQIKKFTSMCGARIPDALLSRLEAAADDPKRVREIGVEHATQQCSQLLEQGTVGIHFYTLNRSLATRTILDDLRQRWG
jgi:methylenetetrahydrofolate reductase (NADPH)